MKKWVYAFDDHIKGDQAYRVHVLGGKGAVLAELFELKFPIPRGFSLSTEVCAYYHFNKNTLPFELSAQVRRALSDLELSEKRNFGDSKKPLFLSVRSGASISMPGMMDTILNLGLNDVTVIGLAENTGDSYFAYETYAHFIRAYGRIIMGVEDVFFKKGLKREGVRYDAVCLDEWLKVVEVYKAIVFEITGKDFHQDVKEQLWRAIEAVLESWKGRRAVKYRELHNIAHDLGTAVTIQTMVFGNISTDSATGVVFTRNPSNGDKQLFGEFLIKAQGEDIVAGIKNASPLTRLCAKGDLASDEQTMEDTMPTVFKQLAEICMRLEAYYRDMQDIEFTVQEGTLWVLQTRAGKRSAQATIKIAVDMVNEGLLSRSEALLRILPSSLNQLLHPMIDERSNIVVNRRVLTIGLAASPGVVSGAVIFSAEAATRAVDIYKSLILVRHETSPEDIEGMGIASGILTARGGMTSHAAVVARGMGKVCICGASDVIIDQVNCTMTINGMIINEGDTLTLNGTNGEVILGEMPTIRPPRSRDYNTILAWADDVRILRVRANAETPKDLQTALEMGAQGIGLCRTEHMFFSTERITSMRKLLLAPSTEERVKALDELLPYQRGDFKQIMRLVSGFPLTIRLLDIPLHEFLPRKEGDIRDFCRATGWKFQLVKDILIKMKENNPMLGHRGCRLAITSPQIYKMQVRAIFEAVVELYKENLINLQTAPDLEIMIPLVISGKEVDIIKNDINSVVDEIRGRFNLYIPYRLGVMIELPQAALRAGEIAERVDFCSFGTNDLTQTVLGISRDDAESFMPSYLKYGIFGANPFISLEQSGVQELVKIAVERARAANPNIKIGMCGEHAGESHTIAFCQSVGMDYISCSPYRIPLARVAAAQAILSQPL